MRVTLCAIPLAIVATLVAGCSSPDEASLAGGSSPAPATSTTTTAPASPTSTTVSSSAPPTKKVPPAGCKPVSRAMRKAIATGLEPGVTLSQAAAVKSPDFAKVYFVAGRLKGSGVDEVGVWASNALTPGGGLILAVDGTAQAFSDWPDADDSAAQISKADPTVRTARACLG